MRRRSKIRLARNQLQNLAERSAGDVVDEAADGDTLKVPSQVIFRVSKVLQDRQGDVLVFRFATFRYANQLIKLSWGGSLEDL